jgi:hypothetical protein
MRKILLNDESGAGSYVAPRLREKSARVTVSGAGKLTLRADESLVATISGAGICNYYGNPKIVQKISGPGKCHRLED